MSKEELYMGGNAGDNAGSNKVAMVYKMPASQELNVQHPGLYLKEEERTQSEFWSS